jgi:Tfp pilus assembly protein PilN
MTPRFSLTPPWARYALLTTGLLCLPIAGLIVHDSSRQQQLTLEAGQMQQQLHTQQQALRTLRDAQQRLMRQQQQQQTTSPSLVMLEKIGSVMRPDVVLRAADVSPGQQAVRLEVSSKSLSAVLEFSQDLQKLPAKVALDNHRQATDKNPEWPVLAVLDVNFHPEKGDEANR